MPAQVGLPIGQRHGGQLLVERLEEFGLADVDLADVREADLLEIGLPGEIGRRARAVPRASSCGSWFRDRAARRGSWTALAICVSMAMTVSASVAAVAGGVAGELEHFGDVLHVLLADLLRFVVVLGVIVAVGKAEAALRGLADHLGAVLVVLTGTEVETARRRPRLCRSETSFSSCGRLEILAMRSSSGCKGLAPWASMRFSSMQLA